MRKTLLFTTAILGFGTGGIALAEPNLNYFKDLIRGATIEKVEASVIDGLYEVSVKESPYPIFLSKDGKYMLEGNAVDLVRGVNLTEQHLNKQNKALVDALDEQEMVTYPADKEEHVVTIFTDIDCPFCQMLHKEMEGYNKEGITVRYLGFPRMGLKSQAYTDLVSVWCAKDPQTALTDAKSGKKIKAASCENPIQKHYELGIQMGIQGTPAIILEDGSIIGGYVPPKELKRSIKAKGL